MEDKKVSNATVMYQGRTYRPQKCKEIFSQNNENINYEDRPIGSNPNNIREPNAFCKIVDDLIDKGILYTKDGQLLTKENKDYLIKSQNSKSYTRKEEKSQKKK